MLTQQLSKFRSTLLTTMTLLSFGLSLGSLLPNHAATAQSIPQSKDSRHYRPMMTKQLKTPDSNSISLNFGNNHVINILDYSWTVSNNGTPIIAPDLGAESSKAIAPNAGEFTFTTDENALSPELKATVASDAPLPLLELDSVDAKGQSTATWKLTNAIITSVQMSEGASHPTESFTVHFDKLEFTYSSNLTQATTSWDYVENQGSISTNGQEQSQKLVDNFLNLGNGQNLAIQSFSWSKSNSGGYTGTSASKVQSGNFTFTTGFGAASTELTFLVNSGSTLKEVIFSQTDAHGKLLNQWILDNVVVASNQISATGNQALDKFTLSASKVTEKVFDAKGNATSQTWDILTNSAQPN